MIIFMLTSNVYNDKITVLPTDVSEEVQYQEAVQLFLMDCRFRNLSPSTIDFYKFHLRGLQRFLEKHDLNFLLLTSNELSVRFINHLMDEGLTSNTINGRIRTCQSFFKFLSQEGITKTNVANDLKLIKAQNQMIYTFTEEQVELILKQPDRNTFTGLRDYVMMIVLLETGVRVMELANMKVSDLLFEEQTIRIPMAKGRKSRRVPIQRTCMTELLKYIQERDQQPFDDLWISINNTPITRNAVGVKVRQHCKDSGIKGVRGSCHTFRHTMAKFFLINGGDIFTIQYILGHTTLDMTKRYVDLFSKDIHQQHERYSPVEHLTTTDGICNESEGY